MAIVTRQNFYVPGTPVTYTLNKADLLAHANVAPSALYSDENNWERVTIKMLSTDGNNQAKYLIFRDTTVASPEDDFETTLVVDSFFEVQNLMIFDKDGGRLILDRSDLVAGDFDIAVNFKPIAQNVNTGGVFETGETLTLNYDYFDANGDAEGATTFQWYRSDDAIGTNKAAIAGETNQTYLLVDPVDTGKYISCVVTPVASTGATPGDPVESSLEGPIVLGVVFSTTALYDTTFVSNQGTGIKEGLIAGTAWEVTTGADGSFFVAGEYDSVNGVDLNNFGKLNADGTPDTVFNANFDGIGTAGFSARTWKGLEQSDGKILVAGEFTAYNNNVRNRLVRLNSDGTEDTAFYTNLGTGFDGRIVAMGLQSDGKIIVAGDFTDVDGTTRNQIARINADGTVDGTFLANAGLVGTVYDLKIDGSDNIYLVGAMSQYNATACPRLLKFDSAGNLDSAFNANLLASGGYETLTCWGIDIQPNGKVVLGTSYSGLISGSGLVRVNTDGTIDTAFQTNVNSVGSISTTVYGVFVQSDGRIAIAGGGSPGVQRFNSNGSDDAAFNSAFSGAGSTAWAGIRGVVPGLPANEKLVIYGSFSTFQGNTSLFSQLMKLN